MLLEDAPRGFTSIVTVLCQIPPDLLADLTNQVLDFVLYIAGDVDVDSLIKRLESQDITVSLQQAKDCVQALAFTLRGALKQEISPENLAAELKSFGASVWTAKAVNVIKKCWSERSASALEIAKDLPTNILNIGRLVSFQWKLGMATSSSITNNIARAYVLVELKISDSALNIRTQTLELTLAEFKVFAKQLKEMKTVMNEII
eukprot:m.333986 g.333986  ORF g.333986 m.333986 type:complete len:204 (-) comp17261_c0_seq1:875-1486(-)